MEFKRTLADRLLDWLTDEQSDNGIISLWTYMPCFKGWVYYKQNQERGG